jgi:phosphoglycerate kinase
MNGASRTAWSTRPAPWPGSAEHGVRTLDDLEEVHGKRALVRVDLNVPMQDGSVSDDTRLRATLPTVTELADRGAIVLLLAHFGRPRRLDRNIPSPASPRAYEHVVGRGVRYVRLGRRRAECRHAPAGDFAILENTRFFGGEEKNDLPWWSASPASVTSTSTTPSPPAHRAHASTEAGARSPAYAGARWSGAEGAGKALGEPERPARGRGRGRRSRPSSSAPHFAKVDH